MINRELLHLLGELDQKRLEVIYEQFEAKIFFGDSPNRGDSISKSQTFNGRKHTNEIEEPTPKPKRR